MSIGTPLLSITIALVAAPLTAQDVEIQEWQVPWEESRPRDPSVGPDGRIWFVGQRTHYVAVFDPATEEFRKYDLDDGTGPHNLIVDEDGTVWYAGNRAAHIGRLDGETGNITKIATPSGVRDPHTLVFDGRGNIWFTAQQSNYVGRFTPATGVIDVVRVPTPRARPYGIRIDGDGRPWIVLFGTNKLATVHPETMEIEEIELPRTESRPRRLEITADGSVWYGDYRGGFIGRYDPQTGEFTEWPLPSGDRSLPYATAIDDNERIWLVETGVRPNQFVAFDTKSKQVVATATIPSGAGSVRHMVYDPATRSIWFGTDANTLGRVRVP